MTKHETGLNFTAQSDKMKGWVRPQPNVLPIIACKNLAFNQRRCVESVGNLVWALTKTANYSKQGKFVSRVWEDALKVQSKVRTLNHNLFCSEVKSFFPSMFKSPWNFASSEAGLTGWLAVYISHIKTGFQLKHRLIFTNYIEPDDWSDGMCTNEIFFIATKDDKLNFGSLFAQKRENF